MYRGGCPPVRCAPPVTRFGPFRASVIGHGFCDGGILLREPGGPNGSTQVLVRGRREGQRQRGDGAREAEFRVRWGHEPEGGSGFLKLEKAREEIPPESFPKAHSPADTFTLDFWPPELPHNAFVVF